MPTWCPGGERVPPTPARTATRKLLPPTPATSSRLIAPSLSSLPNALDAQFWITRANQQLAAGDTQVLAGNPRNIHRRELKN